MRLGPAARRQGVFVWRSRGSPSMGWTHYFPALLTLRVRCEDRAWKSSAFACMFCCVVRQCLTRCRDTRILAAVPARLLLVCEERRTVWKTPHQRTIIQREPPLVLDKATRGSPNAARGLETRLLRYLAGAEFWIKSAAPSPPLTHARSKSPVRPIRPRRAPGTRLFLFGCCNLDFFG